MISCCSTACTLLEPDDGADMGRRLTGTESGLVGYWRFDEAGQPAALAHVTDPDMSFVATAIQGVSDGPSFGRGGATAAAA